MATQALRVEVELHRLKDTGCSSASGRRAAGSYPDVPPTLPLHNRPRLRMKTTLECARPPQVERRTVEEEEVSEPVDVFRDWDVEGRLISLFQKEVWMLSANLSHCPSVEKAGKNC